ncbi:hypothetical protein K2173_027769 [Erythroxylum novogranatense]|uniref:Alkaline/neutral invertase n=1 Tax=Erythroxylum novogranatense TaxID=1862640 RepID=A0AAV8U036_9ROSI|nr:hypothetical protein K2173_027769 [Erythroxylum novogranatense]
MPTGHATYPDLVSCLSEVFDTFPTLLCADGCRMIDRRIAIEIQALFFMALRCALILLKHDEEGKEIMDLIVKTLHALSYHMRNCFWLDLKQLNDIHRYKTEEYSHTAVNKFNVMPDSLPDWHGFSISCQLMEVTSLAMFSVMDLIESRLNELVGEMPLKICYPAIESHEWRIVTGCDPKNTRWSYHNGGWLELATSLKSEEPLINSLAS